MNIEKEGNTTIVSAESGSATDLFNAFKASYAELSSENIIVNLENCTSVSAGELEQFQDISNSHRESGHSFVLVTEQVTYDEVSEELQVVPTLHEAHDLISMDEIERDLGL